MPTLSKSYESWSTQLTFLAPRFLRQHFDKSLLNMGMIFQNGGCCVCYTLWGIITAVVNAATYFMKLLPMFPFAATTYADGSKICKVTMMFHPGQKFS